MKLWLDDIREPWKHGCLGWDWAKTADEAIALLKTGAVTHASLDHDLAEEHYEAVDVKERQEMTGFVFEPPVFSEKTGYAVIQWLEANPEFWPHGGVRVHSMNPAGKLKMQAAIARHYGRIFV